MRHQNLLPDDRTKFAHGAKSLRIYLFPILISLLILNNFFYTSYAADIIELPDELKDLQIRDEFVKSSAKRVGSISVLRGEDKIIVVHKVNNVAYFGSEQDPIYQNDALYTLNNTRCRVVFNDKNEIVMATDTVLEIEEMYESVFKGKKTSVFNMTKGKAIFYIKNFFQYRDNKIQLKTPNTVVSVKGTTFGTEIDRATSQMLNNPKIVTRVYVSEGEVDVSSLIDRKTQRLRKNHIIESDHKGLGELVIDAERTKTFMKSFTSGVEHKGYIQTFDALKEEKESHMGAGRGGFRRR